MRIKAIFLWGVLAISWLKGVRGACSTALGMESGYISDNQLSASSQLSARTAPSHARLNYQSGLGGWCAGRIDRNPYLQIDLPTAYTITKVATQGGNSNWVEKFTLTFSYDKITWFNYTVNGKIKIFPGHIGNPYRTKWNNLTLPLTASSVRFHPVYDAFIMSCLRVELYGCTPSEDCNTAVGVETHKIPDQQITASSHWNHHYAYLGRLNNAPHISSSGKYVWGGWCTNPTDKNNKNKNQYLQVDLGKVRSVSGVATQGYMAEMFVTKYSVNYSTDGYTWHSYKERGDSNSKVFHGNWDNDTVIKKMFSRRIFARYIRFNPLAWNKHGDICMRVEIYECLPTKGNILGLRKLIKKRSRA